MSQKVTKQAIFNFIEANARMFTERFQVTHIKEQISYRMLLCKDDCGKTGKCIKCGCDYPGRVYSSQSCNESRFPNMMSRLDWEEFKKENTIE